MNTVSMIGRLTRDPELGHTAGGTPVANMRIAVPRRRRNGEDQGAVYIDVLTYGAQAEASAAHLVKGRQVGVTGRLEYREWEANDGSRRTRHEIVAEEVRFLDRPAPEPQPETAPAA